MRFPSLASAVVLSFSVLPAGAALASDADGAPAAPASSASSKSTAASAASSKSTAASAASSKSTAASAADGGPSCPVYERYANQRFAFSVDVPTFFTKMGADADGRGQPFAYGTKARARAWAMYNVPQMSLAQLFADWTRRAGVTFRAVANNTWVVRGNDGERYYYSRSILADGIIVSIEITYDPSLADLFEPILARMGPSLQVLEGKGPRAKD